MSGSRLSDMFSDQELGHADTLEDLLSIIENFEEASKGAVPFTPFQETVASPTPTDEAFATLVSKGPSTTTSRVRPRENDDGDGSDDDGDNDASQARKKLKFAADNGEHKISHINVERNRRKQMNEHLTVLRSIMPCFYVKRGDQASIIGGVVDYIKELQQLLQSLESKKQRKVMSPRPVSSPRPSPLSPRPSPLSPRVGLPISPRTPQPGSPYKPRLMQQQQQYYIVSPAISPYNEPSPSLEAAGEVAANSKSAIADVEVKFSGPNLLLKTVSHRIPGQAMKIITALEGLPLEILQVNISTIDETLLNSFTIKIGIECELSAEELAQEIQQTFL